MLSLVIDRDQAARFGIQPSLIDQTLYDAFGQRQVTQYFTQLNSYHVILEVTPALQADPQTLSQDLHQVAGHRIRWCRCRRFVQVRHPARRPLCPSTIRGSSRR